MSTKHTPGPWNLHRDLKASNLWISGDYNAKDDTSQEVTSGIDREANARLIAKAEGRS